jgi:VWFA-related protein
MRHSKQPRNFALIFAVLSAIVVFAALPSVAQTAGQSNAPTDAQQTNAQQTNAQQTNAQQPNAQTGNDQIPDAPSATRPFPKPTVSPNDAPAVPEPVGSQAPDGSPSSSSSPDQTGPPPPPPNITTVPPGSIPREENTNSREELFKISINPSFVNVPVTVKDDRGHLMAGLLPKDFEVLENGQQQKLIFFSSDPFPLTASVVLDLSMPDVELSKVRETLPALMGAFGQFDEVSVYSYGSTVTRVQGFTPAQNDVFIQTIRKLQHTAKGRTGGVPVLNGPMASGPTVNGRPTDPGAAATVNAPQNPSTSIYIPEAHVLNDAILEAAQDLASRDPKHDRRRILFVISNGRELNSDASYNQVLKVLLTQQITVYGVAVGESAIPVYKQLEKVHLPGQGYGDILPKYAKATGGQVFSEFSQQAIETAYNQLTVMAKNQYTLGYMAPRATSGNYRDIEVRVLRPDLKVTARTGYYPLPPDVR